MKKLLVFLLIPLYIISINYLAFSMLNQSSESKNKTSNPNVEEISINDQVGVYVLRDRFYGKIEEFHYPNSSISNLYLLRVRIPLNVNGTNFIIYHFLFSFLFVIIFLMMIWKYFERRENAQVNKISYNTIR